MNSTNRNVPVVGTSNAVAPQNTGIQNGITLAGATANGSALALASAAAAEALGQMQLAKAFPRDEVMAISRITNACQRQELAGVSSYTYSKGGSEIIGASIHLLKAIAAKWGNVKSGYTIVESTNMQTKCEAFATDLETNYTERIPFVVRHIRHTRKGDYPLTDDREIYELVANMAARRERKCLEAVIPADVVQAALNECQTTLVAQCGEITETRIKEMCDAYAKLGVTRAQIEAFIQRPLASVAPAQWVKLQTIYKSIREGIASKDDFFSDLTDGEASAETDKGETAKAESVPAAKTAKKKIGKTVEDFLAENPAVVEDDGSIAEDDLDVM